MIKINNYFNDDLQKEFSTYICNKIINKFPEFATKQEIIKKIILWKPSVYSCGNSKPYDELDEQLTCYYKSALLIGYKDYKIKDCCHFFEVKKGKVYKLIFEQYRNKFLFNANPNITDDYFPKSKKEFEEDIITPLDDYVKNINIEYKLDEIFDYKLIGKNWRNKILADLNIEVCPYCNRQFINKYNYKGDKRVSADLDHFIIKSKFPLFSLSLFNFIPSCQICNSRMKGQILRDVIYPFADGFDDDCYFSLVSKENINKITLEQLFGLENISPMMKISRELNIKNLRIYNSVELYKLKELYETHSGYVKNLNIRKRVFDNDDYLKTLKSVLGENATHRNELQDYLYGCHEATSSVILSKLTADIVNEK